MRRTIVGSSLVFIASCAAWAQTKSAPLSFDVASVKPAEPQPGDRIMRRMAGGPGSTDPGQITWSNVTLKLMLEAAYNLKEYQVDGPDWIESLGFDIVAKMPPGTTQEQMSQMVQTLLAERFKVTFHRETKQLPVMALIVMEPGKMKEAELPAVTDGSPQGGPPPSPGGPMRGPGIRLMAAPDGTRMAGYMTMAQLSNQLTRMLARPVLDMTELSKTYDVDITWAPDEFSQPRLGAAPHPGGHGPEGGPDSRGADAPTATLTQAIQKQLGLKLEARKASAEILIVDHADRVPVEN